MNEVTEVNIIESEGGLTRIFATLTINKYRTMEQAQSIVDRRNANFGNENRFYMLVAA